MHIECNVIYVRKCLCKVCVYVLVWNLCVHMIVFLCKCIIALTLLDACPPISCVRTLIVKTFVGLVCMQIYAPIYYA